MSAESNQKKTVSDPVEQKTLSELRELDDSLTDLSRKLLEFEQEKIRLLSAAHQLEAQKQRIFEMILVERGLSPMAKVNINATTGVLELFPSPSSPFEAPPAAEH